MPIYFFLPSIKPHSFFCTKKKKRKKISKYKNGLIFYFHSHHFVFICIFQFAYSNVALYKELFQVPILIGIFFLLVSYSFITMDFINFSVLFDSNAHQSFTDNHEEEEEKQLL